jgi:hypothetical protein
VNLLWQMGDMVCIYHISKWRIQQYRSNDHVTSYSRGPQYLRAAPRHLFSVSSYYNSKRSINFMYWTADNSCDILYADQLFFAASAYLKENTRSIFRLSACVTKNTDCSNLHRNHGSVVWLTHKLLLHTSMQVPSSFLGCICPENCDFWTQRWCHIITHSDERMVPFPPSCPLSGEI